MKKFLFGLFMCISFAFAFKTNSFALESVIPIWYSPTNGYTGYYYPIHDYITSDNIIAVYTRFSYGYGLALSYYDYDSSQYRVITDGYYETTTDGPKYPFNDTSLYFSGIIRGSYKNTCLIPRYEEGDILPPPSQSIDGLGLDITLSHTEFHIPLASDYWEFISVKNAWNYPTVSKLVFDIYINGEKRDTVSLNNNFTTNFGVAFNFFTSHYNCIKGDVIRVICVPKDSSNNYGLQRGIEWIVGSKENVSISNIPNVTPKVEIDELPYTPTIQKEKQFVYNPITNEYVTNNYYTQNYENPNLENIENQLDYLIQYIIDNPISSGSDSPQTIINYNTTNKNYNLDFGDVSFGDIDVDLEIGNAKEHVRHSFDEFITNMQLLMDSPFEKIVIAFGIGIGLILLVLTIVIVAKILDILIP